MRGRGEPRPGSSPGAAKSDQEHIQLGHTFLWRNVRPESLAAFNSSLQLARRWEADEPANATAKRLIIESDVKLGDAYWFRP